MAATPGAGVTRTIVFAADVAAADATAEVLRAAGMQPLVYHRRVQPDVRAEVLTAMSERQAHLSNYAWLSDPDWAILLSLQDWHPH